MGGAATGGITTAGGCEDTGTVDVGAAGGLGATKGEETVGGFSGTTGGGPETVRGGAFEARLKNASTLSSLGTSVV